MYIILILATFYEIKDIEGHAGVPTMLKPTTKSNQMESSVTLACRFDKTLYNLLQKDSETKGISLNALINSIVRRYISWEKYAQEVGYVPLARDTVRALLDNLDDRELKNIANRVGQIVPREMTLLMFSKIDFDSIITFLEIISSRYGMIQHNINGDIHELIVHHGISKKFSTFLAEVGKAMAEDLSFRYKVLNADSKIISAIIEPI